MKKETAPKPVVKPYVKGNIRDERTVRTVFGFMGIYAIAVFMTFLVCSVLRLDNAVLRTIAAVVVEVVVLMIFFASSNKKGEDAVARGEIIYQRQEKGLTYEESEKAICYHPLKGLVNALLGSLPIFIIAVVLALTTKAQGQGFGTLPSWMNNFVGRSEIGGALTAYTQPAAFTITDIARLIVRMVIMPFVNIVGTEDKNGLVLLERLSPILVLLPAFAYGLGYTQGPAMRTKVHTEIEVNKKKRLRREKKALMAKKKKAAGPKKPEQLN